MRGGGDELWPWMIAVVQAACDLANLAPARARDSLARAGRATESAAR